jgi:hypothetical protein
MTTMLQLLLAVVLDLHFLLLFVLLLSLLRRLMIFLSSVIITGIPAILS